MTGNAAIRVGIADDQRLVRSGFAMVVDSQPDLTVAWEAADGVEAVDLACSDPVDVLLMDVQMPRIDGIEATRVLTERAPSTRVVMVTTFDNDEYVLHAIAAGAAGFLLKDADPEELLSSLRTVHAGDAVVGPRSARRLLANVAPLIRAGGGVPGEADPAAGLPSDLTPRELEVLTLMAHGLSNAEICERLVISEATAKTHVGRVLAKTGARDRVGAVIRAFRSGLVSPEDLADD